MTQLNLVDRGPAGHQGRDRPRSGAAPEAGGPLLMRGPDPTTAPRGNTTGGDTGMSLKRLLIPIAAAALLALGVAACGGGDTKTVTVTGRPRPGGRHGTDGGGLRRDGQASSPACRRPTTAGWARSRRTPRPRPTQYDDVDFELLAGRRRRLAGAADRAGDRQEARRAGRAAAGRRGADARRPEGGEGRHPGRQHRPPVHHAGRRDGDDPRRQLPDRRPRGRLHRRRDSSARATSWRSRASPGSRSPRTAPRASPTAQEEVPGRRHQDRRPAAGRLQPGHRPEGHGEHPPGPEADRRRLHARRRHGPGRRPGDPQRRPRGRDVPHRRRRLRRTR